MKALVIIFCGLALTSVLCANESFGMNTIISVDFDHEKVNVAVETTSKLAIEAGAAKQGYKGVIIENPAPLADRLVTLHLKDVPVLLAMKYIANVCSVKILQTGGIILIRSPFREETLSFTYTEALAQSLAFNNLTKVAINRALRSKNILVDEERIMVVGDVIFVTASEDEISLLKAIIKVAERGFKVAKIE
ncbi:MAG: hypothetical protein WCK77_16760 [Verrucomicrobiota bacterium]